MIDKQDRDKLAATIRKTLSDMQTIPNRSIFTEHNAELLGGIKDAFDDVCKSYEDEIEQLGWE